MGTIMSTFVIGALNENSLLASKVPSDFGLVAFSLAVLSIPVFDTLRVMVRRISRGRSPFSPDRTHLHHLLFDLGFSHIGITIFEILSNLMVVLCWFIAYRAGASVEVQLYVVVFLGMMVTFGFYALVRIMQRRDAKLFHFLQKVGKATHVGHLSVFIRFRRFLDIGCDEMMRESVKDVN